MIASIALIGSVVIGGAFGAATATVQSNDGDVMVIEIEVEVIGSADSVVAHLTFDNEPDQVLALLDRGEGVFGITTELEPKNYVVVFESLGEDASVSDPVTLSDMGADLGPEPSATTDDEEEGLSTESSRFLWLAIALGAASLSVLAFWVLGGREERDDETEPEEDTEVVEAEEVAVAEDDAP
ncbi:MAG TPA: hypothetical protein VG872_08830 [Acidimicrobiia bacterium]|jgi:hypothetical protein|nr:hypothetical protein [Acidimicrobiia bacterium]